MLKQKMLFPVIFLLLQACSETSTNKQVEPVVPPVESTPLASLCDSTATISTFTPVTAIAATTDPNFISGAHAVITGDANGQFSSVNDLRATGGDLTIATYGSHFYIIERQNGGNNITKYAINDPQTVIWQYSTNESASPAVLSNPYAMIFVSETKAYVLRYNKTIAWIVNPSATSDADFKIGEIDLSAYGAGDGTPEMAAGFVADGKLYIVLQRLEGATQQVENDAYIAVFDVATDQEIDVSIPGDTLKGIPLTVRNPTSISYQAATNELFVQASGSFFPMSYVGGIEKIKLADYTRTLVLDDGDDQSHPYGLITSLALVSPDLLYFVGYESYSVNTLYAMNLNTKAISAVNVSQLLGGQIQDLAIDPQGLLWVSDNANATVRILNPLSCEEIDAVSTNLNPAKIVFAQ